MENRNSYYEDFDPILTSGSCDVLERLKRELANKQYFADYVYEMYISENGLNPN